MPFPRFWSCGRESAQNPQTPRWKLGRLSISRSGQSCWLNSRPILASKGKIGGGLLGKGCFPLSPSACQPWRRRTRTCSICASPSTPSPRICSVLRVKPSFIYVGDGCGAGWVMTYQDLPAILFGLENMAERLVGRRFSDKSRERGIAPAFLWLLVQPPRLETDWLLLGTRGDQEPGGEHGYKRDSKAGGI